jgi:hypothetical protein
MNSKIRLAALSLLTSTLASSMLPSMCLAEEATKATPESAYRTYHQAMVNAKTYKDVTPYLVAKAVKEMEDTPAEERKMMFGMLKELCPKDVRIVSSQIDGEKASLKLVVGDGKPVIVDRPIFGKTKEETSGECTMFVENGQWKVDKESWKTKSSSVDSAAPADAAPKTEAKQP